jgi:Rod binding domain-containing protein
MSDIVGPNTSLAMMQAQQADAMSAAKNIKTAKGNEKIDEAATDFEAVFLAEMIKPMFEGISTEAPFGGGKGEEVFRGMMIQEYSKLLAKSGSIGLADSVRTEMIRMQEEANKATGVINE